MERRNGGSFCTFEEGMRPSKEGIPGGMLLTVASSCFDMNEKKDNKICFAWVNMYLYICTGPDPFQQGLVYNFSIQPCYFFPLVSLSPAPVNTLTHPDFKRKISSAELSQIPLRAAFSPLCPRQSCQLLCSSDRMAAFHSERHALLARGCKILWNSSRWIMLYHKYKMNIGLRFLKY